MYSPANIAMAYRSIRLENILARYGGELSRATLANWVIALARPLQPLINLIRDHQQAGNLIMADETRVAGTQKNRGDRRHRINSCG